MAQARPISEEFYFKDMTSPIGRLRLVGNDGGLAAICWAAHGPGAVALLKIVGEDAAHPVLLEAERQLHEYFEGRRDGFDFKLSFSGLPFQ